MINSPFRVMGLCLLLVGTIAGGYLLVTDSNAEDYRQAGENITDPWDTPTATESNSTFMISTGDDPPPGWGYPLQIEVRHMNSSTIYLTTVYERERFDLDLETGERYRIIAEQPNGKERDIGVFTYSAESPDPMHIIVG